MLNHEVAGAGGVVTAPVVTVIAAVADVAGTVVPGTDTVRGLVNEAPDTVGRDMAMGMLMEGMLTEGMLIERLALLLDMELRLELELGEEVLEMLLLLGEEVLTLELLDEEELLELELDEELLDEVLLLELELALELGEVGSALVEGRLGALMDEIMGEVPLPVHTPLQATIWPLTH